MIWWASWRASTSRLRAWWSDWRAACMTGLAAPLFQSAGLSGRTDPGDRGDQAVGLADLGVQVVELGLGSGDVLAVGLGQVDEVLELAGQGHEAVLVALARKPWQVFSREILLEQVWGYRHAGDTRLVNVHVQRLRSKIERDPEHPEVVVTVRGVGYKAGPA